jgi:hypothetical protein
MRDWDTWVASHQYDSATWAQVRREDRSRPHHVRDEEPPDEVRLWGELCAGTVARD